MKFDEKWTKLAMASILANAHQQMLNDATVFMKLGDLARHSEDPIMVSDGDGWNMVSLSVTEWYGTMAFFASGEVQQLMTEFEPHLTAPQHARNLQLVREFMAALTRGETPPLPQLEEPEPVKEGFTWGPECDDKTKQYLKMLRSTHDGAEIAVSIHLGKKREKAAAAKASSRTPDKT